YRAGSVYTLVPIFCPRLAKTSRGCSQALLQRLAITDDYRAGSVYTLVPIFCPRLAKTSRGCSQALLQRLA
ncbi:hypothetical protein, partial [Salmonella enterica]|uniref:hypothetical protein n=1 Tax=Salmonella enterica TaxID=28901 RepID=UPI002FCD7F33